MARQKSSSPTRKLKFGSAALLAASVAIILGLYIAFNLSFEEIKIAAGIAAGLLATHFGVEYSIKPDPQDEITP